MRERLFALLDDKLAAAPVVWIAAPPGAGKTATVASYLESRKLRRRWFQIDSGDRDPATFFFHLGEMLAQVHPKGRPPIPRFTADHGLDLRGFSRRFFRELFSQLEPGLLVLDNCHEAASESFDVILREAFSQVPAGANIVLISRSAPEPSFLRLIANQTIAELGWTDLRFTESEVASIIRIFRPDAGWPITDLYVACDGWAAGLVLMLRSQGRSADRATGFKSREFLFEYFTEEAFTAADPRARKILVCTALLPQTTSAMARALCDDPEADTVLEALHRQQYFVDRRAEGEVTYQFHDIFRDFLLARGPLELDHEHLSNVRIKAAHLLEQRGLLTEAVALHRQSRNWSEITRLIKTHALDLYDTGRWQTINEWYRDLPENFIDVDPYLVYWKGKGQMPLAPALGMELVGAAVSAFSRENNEDAIFFAVNDLIDLTFILDAPLHNVATWLPLLEGQLERDPNFRSDETAVQAWGAYVAIAIQTPCVGRLLDAAARQLRNAIETVPLSANDRLNTSYLVLGCDLIAGNYSRGQRQYALTHSLIELEEVSPIPRLFGVTWLGHWSVACGNFPQAIQQFNRAIDLSAQLNAARQTLRSRVHLAFVMCLSYRLEEAQAVLRSLSLEIDRAGELTQGLYWTAMAASEAALGCFANAMTFVNAALQHYEKAHYRTRWVLCLTWKAAFHTELRQPVEALDVLRKMREDSLNVMFRQYDALALVVEYKARTQLQQPEAARDCLMQALSLAGNPLQSAQLLAVRHWLPELCAAALEQGIEVRTITALIRLWKLQPANCADPTWPWAVKVRTMGNFEVLIDDAAPEFSRKPPARLIGLLKAIVAFGGADVPAQKLIDAVWPDESGDAAARSLNVALTRLRKLLVHGEVIQVVNGKITLDHTRCWIDSLAFEKLAASARSLTLDEPAHINALDGIVALYGGEFLQADRDAAWAIPTRERLRDVFVRLVERLAEHFESKRDWERAARYHQRGIDTDPLFELFHRGLIRCYMCAGRRAEALSAYRRLRQTLSVVLGISPAAETEALYQDLYRALPNAERTEISNS
jgi:DNA-binding SARP family transcriptional activator